MISRILFIMLLTVSTMWAKQDSTAISPDSSLTLLLNTAQSNLATITDHLTAEQSRDQINFQDGRLLGQKEVWNYIIQQIEEKRKKQPKR